MTTSVATLTFAACPELARWAWGHGSTLAAVGVRFTEGADHAEVLCWCWGPATWSSHPSHDPGRLNKMSPLRVRLTPGEMVLLAERFSGAA